MERCLLCLPGALVGAVWEPNPAFLARFVQPQILPYSSFRAWGLDHTRGFAELGEGERLVLTHKGMGVVLAHGGCSWMGKMVLNLSSCERLLIEREVETEGNFAVINEAKECGLLLAEQTDCGTSVDRLTRSRQILRKRDMLCLLQ